MYWTSREVKYGKIYGILNYDENDKVVRYMEEWIVYMVRYLYILIDTAANDATKEMD